MSVPQHSRHDFLDTPSAYQQPVDLAFELATTSAQQAGFWQLRKSIFCDEQRIFVDTDRDSFDDVMSPIVCQLLVMGCPDDVVGCVRIYETEPGIWWGGRLGVTSAYRHLDIVSPAVAVRARYPDSWRCRSIGAGLIFKAVSTARERGCRVFFANVQHPNVPFFERLGWKKRSDQRLHGRMHATMWADLDRYPLDSQGQTATGELQ
jgi:hypothetical protein